MLATQCNSRGQGGAHAQRQQGDVRRCGRDGGDAVDDWSTSPQVRQVTGSETFPNWGYFETLKYMHSFLSRRITCGSLWTRSSQLLKPSIVLGWMGDPLVSCWNWVPPSILNFFTARCVWCLAGTVVFPGTSPYGTGPGSDAQMRQSIRCQMPACYPVRHAGRTSLRPLTYHAQEDQQEKTPDTWASPVPHTGRAVVAGPLPAWLGCRPPITGCRPPAPRTAGQAEP